MKTEWLNFQSFSLVIDDNNNKTCNSQIWHHDTENTEKSSAPRDTDWLSQISSDKEFYGSLHHLVLKVETHSRQNGSYYSLKSLNFGLHHIGYNCFRFLRFGVNYGTLVFLGLENWLNRHLVQGWVMKRDWIFSWDRLASEEK